MTIKHLLHPFYFQYSYGLPYDFLLLREKSGEDLNGVGAWWTKKIAN